MQPVYVIDCLRTPFGSLGGILSTVAAPKLAGGLIQSLMTRQGLANNAIDEVILGQVLTAGVGQAPARQATLLGGLDQRTHAMQIGKVCGSGLKAIMLGAGSIMLGDSDLVLAGGMENMSMAPYALPQARNGFRMGDGSIVDLMIYDALQDPYSGKHMGLITEQSCSEHNISREAQDEYAVRSYKLALAAQESGRLAQEILPVTISGKKGEVVHAEDEDPKAVRFDKIPGLRPVFKKDGTVTAANASSINDGAAVALLASQAAMQKHGLEPKAKLIAYATNSIHPEQFGVAPVGAMQKALDKAGLKADQIGLWEINEAFAAVPLMAIQQMKLDLNRVNVNGGAVSIGHPVGASGARLVTTLVTEMQLRKEKYGIASLCIGGGEAVAAIFELV